MALGETAAMLRFVYFDLAVITASWKHATCDDVTMQALQVATIKLHEQQQAHNTTTTTTATVGHKQRKQT